MGTDIHGVVEINPHPSLSGSTWFDVVDAGMILGRSYNMFGVLFGLKNVAGLKPVSNQRGVPEITGTGFARRPRSGIPLMDLDQLQGDQVH